MSPMGVNGDEMGMDSLGIDSSGMAILIYPYLSLKLPFFISTPSSLWWQIDDPEFDLEKVEVDFKVISLSRKYH